MAYKLYFGIISFFTELFPPVIFLFELFSFSGVILFWFPELFLLELIARVILFWIICHSITLLLVICHQICKFKMLEIVSCSFFLKDFQYSHIGNNLNTLHISKIVISYLSNSYCQNKEILLENLYLAWNLFLLV